MQDRVYSHSFGMHGEFKERQWTVDIYVHAACLNRPLGEYLWSKHEL